MNETCSAAIMFAISITIIEVEQAIVRKYNRYVDVIT